MKRISLLTGAIVCTPIQLWRQPDGCGWGIGRRRKCGPRIGRAARFGAVATRGGWRRRRRETLHALQSQVLDASHGSHALLGQVARDQRAARRHRPAASLEARRGLEDEAGHGARAHLGLHQLFARRRCWRSSTPVLRAALIPSAAAAGRNGNGNGNENGNGRSNGHGSDGNAALTGALPAADANGSNAAAHVAAHAASHAASHADAYAAARAARGRSGDAHRLVRVPALPENPKAWIVMLLEDIQEFSLKLRNSQDKFGLLLES